MAEWIKGLPEICLTLLYIASLLLMLAATAYAIIRAMSAHRTRHRIARGVCPTCSYDLRAHAPGQKCPECGTPVAAKDGPAP